MIYIPIAIAIFVIAYSLGRKSVKCFSPKDGTTLLEMQEAGRRETQRIIKRRKELILAEAQKQGKITNDDVEDMFCISDRTAARYLNELEHEGKLKQIGKSGRGVYYQIKLSRQESKDSSNEEPSDVRRRNLDGR